MGVPNLTSLRHLDATHQRFVAILSS